MTSTSFMKVTKLFLFIGVGLTFGCDGHSQKSGTTVELQPVETKITPESKQALIEIHPAQYNFGDVLIPTQEKTASFTVRNLSSQQIVITNLISTCGCTVARPEKSRLNAGETTIINATVTPKSAGNHDSVVRLIAKRSDGTEYAAGSLELAWNAIPRFLVEPERIDAGRIPVEFEWKTEIKINTLKEYPLSKIVSEVDSSPKDQLSVSMEVSSESTGSLKLSILPGPEPGDFRGTITLHCADPVGEIQIPVTWTRVRSVFLEPRSVFSGRLSPDADLSATFLVRSETGTITNVKADFGASVWDTERVRDDAWRCRLKGKAPGVPGPFVSAFAISVTHNDKQTENLQFKVTGIVEVKE